ncbi:hypothetical protein L484_005801 [Morus notabilis]|uniref:Plant bHLH transcription factor ACT-like domain-containing protein n=1 Tax=Morus notabilis TaxID=981085 RepID=W9S2I7_9ROSA|nr:uncharacterized protein LOC21389256 [Morus notabilis]EXB84037.1 hypothetical protein L484_005801 [Morus notabilis]
MGSSRLQKRIALRRKLHILRALNTSSKSHVKSSSTILMNTFLYIYLLKLKLEAVKRVYSNLLAIKNDYLNLTKNFHVPKEVKVEKTEEGSFDVRVRCEKGEDTLVSVLEAFEEMNLSVLQASVSCEDIWFSMEATVVAQTHDHHDDQASLNVKSITQAITKAISHH